MLRFLLKITVAWFSVSLLCSVIWALLVHLVPRRKAWQAHTVIGTSARTLSETKLEALLTTPATSDPIGTHDDTSQLVRGPKVAKVSS